MDKWLTSYDAADLIGRHRTRIENWGRNGRVRRKQGISPERHHRPMWLYHIDDVLNPKPLRYYSDQSKPANLEWAVYHKPWTPEGLSL